MQKYTEEWYKMPHTIQEWFESVEDKELRKELLSLYDPKFSRVQNHDALMYAIDRAFDWDNQTKPLEYWSGLFIMAQHNRIKLRKPEPEESKGANYKDSEDWTLRAGHKIYMTGFREPDNMNYKEQTEQISAIIKEESKEGLDWKQIEREFTFDWYDQISVKKLKQILNFFKSKLKTDTDGK